MDIETRCFVLRRGVFRLDYIVTVSYINMPISKWESDTSLLDKVTKISGFAQDRNVGGNAIYSDECPEISIINRFSFYSGARCSSVVRAFAHGVMGRRIDLSWWTHWAISLSSQCFTTGVTKYVLCCLCENAYKITLDVNRKELPMWRQRVSSLAIWVVFYNMSDAI